jgi:hypothetical protein
VRKEKERGGTKKGKRKKEEEYRKERDRKLDCC